MNETNSLLQEINRGQNGNLIFENGKYYTVFRINGMAMTSKQIFKVTGFDADGNPIYKEPKGRKQYLLRLKERAYSSAPEKMFDGLVFEGTVPFSCDSDSKSPYYTGCFCGNALFNMVGDLTTIKNTIQEKQLNPWADITAVIHVLRQKGQEDAIETVLFPELYQGGHAVIDRILNK